MVSVASVHRSTKELLDQLEHVSINQDNLNNFVAANYSKFNHKLLPPDWEQDYHFFNQQQPDLTLQYILVLDALNFCFWPLDGYEYSHLAKSLKMEAISNPEFFQATNLVALTEEALSKVLLQSLESSSTIGKIPLLKERCRLLQEIGSGLIAKFDSQVINMVNQAQSSASKLVDFVVETFPGFRDHSIYRGTQVFLYKRAQIFVGDVYGAFKGESFGKFTDIATLTAFADYRVPQLLFDFKILEYSPSLTSKIDRLEQLPANGSEEVEIRIATIQAVEKLRALMNVKYKENGLPELISIQMDWILWEQGEARLASLQPHHRVLTVYY